MIDSARSFTKVTEELTLGVALLAGWAHAEWARPVRFGTCNMRDLGCSRDAHNQRAVEMALNSSKSIRGEYARLIP